MNHEILSIVGMVMGFVLLVLSAFGGKKFLDHGDGAFGLGFVGLVIFLVSVATAVGTFPPHP